MAKKEIIKREYNYGTYARSIDVHLRLSKFEYNEVKKMAKKLNLTISDWVRKTIFKLR